QAVGGLWDVVLEHPQGRNVTFVAQAGGGYIGPADFPATLVKQGDGTYTLTHKDQSSWSFATGGGLTQLKDRHGNTSTLTYNGSGQLSGVADPAGRGSLTLVYGSSGGATGKVVTVQDWLSPARSVQFGYDGYGRLTSATDREAS
ncbi:MAG: hypothetical protein L0Y54_02475, partial [Sporichthyaceae bacterium]|nr:hypothetical protein [Sporichthyaceae bacterium]